MAFWGRKKPKRPINKVVNFRKIGRLWFMTEPTVVTATAKGTSIGMVGKRVKPQQPKEVMDYRDEMDNPPLEQKMLSNELAHFLNEVLLVSHPMDNLITGDEIWRALCLSYVRLQDIHGD